MKNKKKQQKMKIVYHYVKPKNEEEAKEQQRKVDMAYDMLFKATIEEMGKSSDPAHVAFLKKFPYLKGD